MSRNPLRDCTKVMVVAHPDDESFWGGITLTSEPGWGVICVTHKDNRRRRRSMRRALKILGVPGIQFAVPDRGGETPQDHDFDSVWHRVYETINAPSTQRVLTHGPDGEYGHPMHRFLSMKVSESLTNQELLWYFSFDEETDHAVRSPDLWQKKTASLEAHLGPVESWEASDHCHLKLARHEAPCRADEYARPTDLLTSTYSSLGNFLT